MTDHPKSAADNSVGGGVTSDKSFDEAPVSATADRQGRPKKKKTKSLLVNFLVYVLIVGGIVFGLPRILTKVLNTPYPMAAITSGSMWPALKEGDLVLIRGISDLSEIQVGDIIVFQNRTNSTLTIHRVVKLGDKITTKGDANFNEDAPVDFGDVIGETVIFRKKPLRIPFLGSVTVFASNLRQPKND